MSILANRVENHIEKLAAFTSTPERGVTRVLYSEEDRKAKAYIKQEMESLLLEVKEDEIGNIFAVWKGKQPHSPQVWTGSHMDAPTNGGKYDGVVGVIGSLEAIRLLQEKGFQPEHDIVLVVFAAEEPTKFGVGCLGSRALAGMISEQDFSQWTDEQQNTLQQVLTSMGKDPEKVLTQRLNPEQIKSFIELHIEQGAILENEGKSIGVVDIISAPTEIHLTIYGEQRHAGSTPMHLRKDPMPAASETVLLVEQLTRKMSDTSVGTVGKATMYPGTSNVIPEKVELSIDIRDIDKPKKDEILYTLRSKVEAAVHSRGLSYEWTVKADDTPSKMDASFIETIKRCAKDLDLSYRVMPSGAYHDALIMSRKVPANLIFIPSEKGISHAPEEYTPTYQIVQGIELLAACLQES